MKCLFEIPQVDAGKSPKYLQHSFCHNWNEEPCFQSFSPLFLFEVVNHPTSQQLPIQKVQEIKDIENTQNFKTFKQKQEKLDERESL